MIDRIIGHFNESARLKLDMADLLPPAIERAAELVLQCILRDGKVMACGNGGSAADAQHFASLMVNRFEQERPALAAMALSTDTSTLTSIANDSAFDQVFARQVTALGHPGDVLLAISTSGQSPNILAAADAARRRDMTVIALTGRDGGGLAEQLSDHDVLICVPADSTARIQEIHLLTIHCLCDAVDSALLGV
ncbi:MAG: phosphoheptose isomerase [Hydrogenophilaceae bacterium]|nr:phosphoheptose isomerase [Hydrogenophilaceae bacterium]